MDELKKLAKVPERAAGLEKHEERNFTFMLKEMVWDFEQNNYQHIVFYHRESKWWQAGDHSMLMYYYHAAKQLGIKDLKIRHDNDYNKKNWRFGYVTTGRIDSVLRNLQLAGYNLVIDTAEIKVVAMPKKIPPETLEVWQNAEDEKEKRFNALVVPKNLYPKILSKSAILHREIINKVANLSPARQKYYGDQGAELIAWISYHAIVMANGRMEVMEYFEQTLINLDMLNDWLAYVKKFDLFDIDTDLRIVCDISDLKALVTTELGILRKKHQKDNKAARC